MSEAWSAVLRSCGRWAVAPADQALGGGSRASDWAAVCAAARVVTPGDEGAARRFLDAAFDRIAVNGPVSVGGYFEPEVAGSRERMRPYEVALLGRPADLVDGVPYLSRAQIDAGALRRQRLEVVYLRNSVDAFFVQLEGAGRIDLPDGHVVRVGFAGSNHQVSVPLGRILVARGALAPGEVSTRAIRAWLEAHPGEARATMQADPAYVFVRETPGLSPDLGPLGALGVQLTPGRSLAVDPRLIPLGAPVWMEQAGVGRLLVAQDAGSAPAVFFGTGTAAEVAADRPPAPALLWVLLPKHPQG